MNKRVVVHRSYPKSGRTGCNKPITSKMKVFIDPPIDWSKSLTLEEAASRDDERDGVTCKLCIGDKSPLQEASYMKKRLLADVGMARSCLRRIQAVTGQKVDEANLAALYRSVVEWYAAKKLEYAK